MQAPTTLASPSLPKVALPFVFYLCTTVNASAGTFDNTPDTHLTIFENLGEMMPDAAYIHILAPVNLSHFQHTFTRARQLLRNITDEMVQSDAWYNAVWYDPAKVDRMHMTIIPQNNISNSIGVSISHQLQTMQTQVRELINLMPTHADNTRNKRELTLIAVGLAALIGGIIGTYLGRYSQAQIDELKVTKDMDLLLHVDDQHHELIDNLQKRVDLAFQILTENQRAELDTIHTVWSGILATLRYRTDQLTQFITELQRGRLSMTWFTVQQMKTLHRQVLQQAKDHNLTPLVSHLSDYFQLDVTYVKADDYLTAIIHVPATASNKIFTVYRYIPFPIPVGADQMVSVCAEENIIAVGPDHHHKVMTKEQFDNCVRRNNHFICETPLITNTNFSTTCVGSLMDHDHEGIKQHCALSYTKTQEMVFQLAMHKFVVFSPITFTGRGNCLNGSHLSMLISKVTTVEIPRGCDLRLKHHILKVPSNVIASTTPWVQETKWDTLEIPKALFAKRMKEEAHLRQLMADDVQVKAKIDHQLAASVQNLKDAHAKVKQHIAETEANTGKLLTYIIGGTLIGVVGLLCLCACVRYCCNYHRNPQYVPAQFTMR